MRIAFTREVSESIADCQLTHLSRAPIDLARARHQHRAYESALESLGCRIQRLPAAHDLPDAVFVEDLAVVLPELVILARPGAASRRPELRTVEPALDGMRPLARIEPPGTLEGGDVLVVGRTLYVGRSARSNQEGIEQLVRHTAPFGYLVRPVPIDRCLHLKSAVTQVRDDLLLIQPAWVDARRFAPLSVLEVDPSEEYAANALRLDDAVVHPAAFSRTRARLEAGGVRVVAVDLSELALAEGGVTCCSLILTA